MTDFIQHRAWRIGSVASCLTRLVASISFLIVVASVPSIAFADIWVDVKTGEPVKTFMVIPGAGGDHPWGKEHHIVTPSISDPNTAYDDVTHRNFAKNECGDWIDVKTGEPVKTFMVIPGAGGDHPWGKEHHIVTPSISDPNTAYDDVTHRNFAKEPCTPPKKQAAIKDPRARKSTVGFRAPGVSDLYAGQAQSEAPPVGMIIEPHVAIGYGGSSGTSSYSSTGTQAPFSGGDWSTGDVQLSVGATLYPDFGVIGPVHTGFDLNVSSGPNTFGSDTQFFQILRHGATGNVQLSASSNVVIDTMFKVAFPLNNDVVISGGIGPTLRQIDLKLTSDQSAFGGGMPSTTHSTWQTGIGFSAGVSTPVCSDCVGGFPLMIGVDTRVRRYLESQSVNLTSPSFGFTETGNVSGTMDYSANVILSVPLFGQSSDLLRNHHGFDSDINSEFSKQPTSQDVLDKCTATSTCP